MLFGVQNVGFLRDRDVIRVGANLGQFDRVQLRVLDNDVFIQELDVVYVDGTTQKLVVNSDVKQNTRTRWLDITGTKFIKEIKMTLPLAARTSRARRGSRSTVRSPKAGSAPMAVAVSSTRAGFCSAPRPPAASCAPRRTASRSAATRVCSSGSA